MVVDCQFPLGLRHHDPFLGLAHLYCATFSLVFNKRAVDSETGVEVGQFLMFKGVGLFRKFSTSFNSVKEFKPSIFTGKANFYEILYFLDDILLKVKDVNKDPQGIEFNWLNREKLQNKLGFEMSLLEFRQIRQRLSKIQPSAAVSPNVMEFLCVFGDAVRTETDSKLSSEHAQLELKKESSLGWVDELGRVVAIGRRKSSSAKIMLVPGTGEFRVNGIPLVDYFVKPRDIYSIAKPFQVTEQFGKFNVWSLAQSGGHSGIFIYIDFDLFYFLIRSIWRYRSWTSQGIGYL